MNKIFNLSNKVAIVTGSARGIGKAIALSLAKQGAHIVVSDIINGNATVKAIKKLKRKSIFVKTDVSKKEDVNNLVNTTLKKFRRIDILVNNAGILKMCPAEKISEEDWDKIMAVNLKGYFLCAKAVSKQMMKQRSGNIINVASIAGINAFATIAAYCASKAGIILLTKTLAVEWAKYNIRVNAICPGVIVTAMTKGLLADKNFKKMILTKTPLGRAGKPEEMASVAVFLASPASSYVTGHALVADGGWTAGL